MKAAFNAETGIMTLEMLVADPQQFTPAEEGKVYDMAFTSGGFQDTTIRGADGRTLKVQVMAGYIDPIKKAAAAAARKAQKNGK